MSRPDVRLAAALLLPPLVIGLVGTTHPDHLTMGAATYWRDMHVVLLPLFPLLAVGPWLLARSVDPVYGRITLVLGYVYACFYSALDILAGIAAGGLKADREGGLGTVFGLASDLGQVGSIAYIGATAAAAGCVIRVAGLRALPGALVALAGAFGFMEEHVYWPRGVLSMAAIAVGWVWLLISLRSAQRPATSPVP
ncbi:hypothetical protein [Aeromicrobium chenweiae]|uniref:Uncharacterized protein n=1 Tax=Aeromicrobium chenweiae TaxID=2079793 RepID=A0A2S0WM21_9ACTN|nr:hypothetical protein [Aeromicrobium chenweiae]AWB92357.1 hypothetical protein C3E78_09165 [Aeromicrobium chenweiae]TGN31356.1 hypothetical protein E4L97_13405 [Aeromicrobium chenweiae]